MSITRPRRQRSRITNGSALLPNVDGRGAWIRRTKDLIELHTSDLGGPDHISQAELSIVRRAAVMTVELETMEATFAMTGSATPEQLSLYSTVSNSLRRLLETIGLGRRAKDVTPTITEFLADHARQKAAHAPVEPVGRPSPAPER